VGYDYDLVVIGSGPAGECGAVEAASLGKRVLVIERAAEPGGAAVHTGTLPSKTLRETALFLSGKEQREVYGVNISVEHGLFVPKLLSRKSAVTKLEVARIRAAFARAGIEVVHGSGHLSGAHQITITAADGEPQTVTAGLVLVATGSIPFRPSELPWDRVDLEDSDSILKLDKMPESMCVLGAGVIGCEYASMFAALGVRVTLIDKRDELLPFLDRDMSEALRQALVKMGVDVRLCDSSTTITRGVAHAVVNLVSGDRVVVDKVLFCGGRSGATEGLGLDAFQVKMGTRGSIAVDDCYVSSVPWILAAGDVIGFPALASTSMEQGRLAVRHAFGEPPCSAEDGKIASLLPYGIYTIPEVSCVGLSEEDAIEQKGIDAVAGCGDFALNARAKINGFHDGFVKLVFDRKTRRLIGAHAIGDRATELVHIGQVLCAMGATVDAIASAVMNYPTLSECFKHAAKDALSNWALPPKILPPRRSTVAPPAMTGATSDRVTADPPKAS